MKFIITSEKIKKEQNLGGKATHLSNLQQMNLNVPPFFVIHPNAFYNELSNKQKDTLKIIFPFAIILAGVGLIESLMTLTLIDDIYKDIADIEGKNIYDRITSVATFEHLCELPLILSKAGILLKKDGTLRVAIPSEGTILWRLGWKLTTGLEFRLKYGLDWGELIAHEHVNEASEIETLLRYFFDDVEVSVFGFSKSFSVEICSFSPQSCSFL